MARRLKHFHKKNNLKGHAVTRSFEVVITYSQSGKDGIRTRDTLLTYTRFPGVPLQPLEHLSFSFASAKIRQRCES